MSLVSELLNINNSVVFVLFSLVLYFLSALSKRLGEVMGMRKYYYLNYAGMFFTLLGSIIIALSFENARLIGDFLFAAGLTLGIIASIKYWGWLIKELVKG